MTGVENKTPDVSSLEKKTDYNTKINDIEKKVTDHDHVKYITTSEFNKLTTENFAGRLAEANVIAKTDCDSKLMSLNRKIKLEKTKHVLVENELQTFYSSLFIDQSYLNNDRAKLYLIFQPIHKTATTFSGVPDPIPEWKCKGLSNEKIMTPHTTNKSLSIKLVWYNSRIKLKFGGSCLKQDKATFTPKNVVSLFVYELDTWSRDLNTDFTLKNCLFGSVMLTKNDNPDKYSY